MRDFEATHQGLVDSLESMAVSLGGMDFMSGDVDFVKQARERGIKGMSSTNHFEFEAHHIVRDDDTADTLYTVHDGISSTVPKLPGLVLTLLDITEADICPEKPILFTDCTNFTYSVLDREVEISRTQRYEVPDEVEFFAPVVDGSPVQHDEDLAELAKYVIETESGLKIIDYTVTPPAKKSHDIFDEIVGSLQAESTAAVTRIARALQTLELLR